MTTFLLIVIAVLLALAVHAARTIARNQAELGKIHVAAYNILRGIKDEIRRSGRGS